MTNDITIQVKIPAPMPPPTKTYTDKYEAAVMYSDRSGIIALVPTAEWALRIAKAIQEECFLLSVGNAIPVRLSDGEIIREGKFQGGSDE